MIAILYTKDLGTFHLNLCVCPVCKDFSCFLIDSMCSEYLSMPVCSIASVSCIENK
eukprot:GAHX01006924.1.p1 GENE.GAHX01006924.1~~GAHX01006924.1.p1  ORF type:complete len:56 (-),score=3.72 GAHX01006924.1:126-293(-)